MVISSPLNNIDYRSHGAFSRNNPERRNNSKRRHDDDRDPYEERQMYERRSGYNTDKARYYRNNKQTSGYSNNDHQYESSKRHVKNREQRHFSNHDKDRDNKNRYIADKGRHHSYGTSKLPYSHQSQSQKVTCSMKAVEAVASATRSSVSSSETNTCLIPVSPSSTANTTSISPSSLSHQDTSINQLRGTHHNAAENLMVPAGTCYHDSWDRRHIDQQCLQTHHSAHAYRYDWRGYTSSSTLGYTLQQQRHQQYERSPHNQQPKTSNQSMPYNEQYYNDGTPVSSYRSSIRVDQRPFMVANEPSLPSPYPISAAHYSSVRPQATFEELGYPYPTFEDPSLLYQKLGQVGEGTYGKVYKARNSMTGQLIALKRIRIKTEKEGFPLTAIREIGLLQKLKHERIVLLQEVLVSNGSIYMVLEYMDHDLSGILKHPEFKFKSAHIKSLIKQLLHGLVYLHQMGILHRDIKGSNLLLNNKGELKIADFGLARIFHKDRPGDYTNRVMTLCYRPPELLLGATTYGTSVDIWGVGCIMLELFIGTPLFHGSDEISQLYSIYQLLGTPTKETWPEVSQLPWYELVKPKERCENVLRDTYKSILTPGALTLAEVLLSIDPKHRPSAAQALKFDYFVTEEPGDCLPGNLLDIHDDWHDFDSKRRIRETMV